MMNKFLLKKSPPGTDASKEAAIFITGWIISFVFSIFDFLGRYVLQYNNLYVNISGETVLKTYVKMPSFRSLISYSFYGYIILAFCCVCLIVFNYSQFFIGSKSIYLMKRLPKRNEIHIRACTLPILAILVIVISVFLIKMIYFAIYMIFTPKICIASGQWQNLWRIFWC